MQERPKFCTKCGAPIDDKQKFCYYCGTSVMSMMVPSEPSEEEPLPTVRGVVQQSLEISTDEESSCASDAAISLDAESSASLLDGDEPVELKNEDGASAPEDTESGDAVGSDSESDSPLESSDDPRERDKAAALDALGPSGLSGSAEGVQAATEPLSSLSPSQVPTTEIPRVAASSGPGNTSPMPLVADSARSGSAGSFQDTQVMEPLEPQVRQYRQASDNVRTSESGSKKTVLAVVITIVVTALVVLLAVFAFGGFQSGATQDSDSSTSTSSASEATQTPATTDDPKKDEKTEPMSTEDRTIYQQLNTHYSYLGSYDSDIADVANEFNSTYLKKSLSTRSDAAERAYSLMNQISDDYYELQALDVPSTSAYYACYNDMLTCYYDCLMRIEVICSAWDLSLSYSDPKGHEDEICEPLARDRVNGNNKYLTEFKGLYPSAKPEAPRR